jgi:hypothetical protein
MSVEDVDKIDLVNIGAEPGFLQSVITSTGMKMRASIFLCFKINSTHIWNLSRAVSSTPSFLGQSEEKIVIQFAGKFPLSDEAKKVYHMVGKAIGELGYSLRFNHAPSG